MFFIPYRRVTDWIQVVPKASAVVPGVADAEPISIPADHLNMVKFASRDDGGQQGVRASVATGKRGTGRY